jgi:hypothetical protein
VHAAVCRPPPGFTKTSFQFVLGGGGGSRDKCKLNLNSIFCSHVFVTSHSPCYIVTVPVCVNGLVLRYSQQVN